MRRLDRLLLFGCIFGAACSDAPPGPTCVANLPTMCNELYPPTFQQLYDNVLHPTCASGSGTCHTLDSGKGGLIFEDQTVSYRLLLGMIDGRARVIPGDPACSLIIERLESPNANYRMPPGSAPLPDAARCSFIKWIVQGAQP